MKHCQSPKRIPRNIPFESLQCCGTPELQGRVGGTPRYTEKSKYTVGYPELTGYPYKPVLHAPKQHPCSSKSQPCTAQVARHPSMQSDPTTDAWNFSYHTSCSSFWGFLRTKFLKWMFEKSYKSIVRILIYYYTRSSIASNLLKPNPIWRLTLLISRHR